MRKYMTKEVTKTTVKVAVMSVDASGLPVARKLEDIVLIGNVSTEKAQKEVNKRFKETEVGNVTVFGVEASTETYKLPVEEFLLYATLVTPEEVTQLEIDNDNRVEEDADETETPEA